MIVVWISVLGECDLLYVCKTAGWSLALVTLLWNLHGQSQSRTSQVLSPVCPVDSKDLKREPHTEHPEPSSLLSSFWHFAIHEVSGRYSWRWTAPKIWHSLPRIRPGDHKLFESITILTQPVKQQTRLQSRIDLKTWRPFKIELKPWSLKCIHQKWNCTWASPETRTLDAHLSECDHTPKSF